MVVYKLNIIALLMLLVVFIGPELSFSQSQCQNIYHPVDGSKQLAFKVPPLTQLHEGVTLNEVTRSNPWHFLLSKTLRRYIMDKFPEALQYWGWVRLDSHSGNMDVVADSKKVTLGVVDYDDIRWAPLIFELLKKIVIVKTTTATVSTKEIVDYYIKGLHGEVLNPHEYLDLPEGKKGSKVYHSNFDLKKIENRYALKQSRQLNLSNGHSKNQESTPFQGYRRQFKSRKDFFQLPEFDYKALEKSIQAILGPNWLVHDIIQYKKSGGGSLGAERFRFLVQYIGGTNGTSAKQALRNSQNGFKVVELKEKYKSQMDLMYNWLDALLLPSDPNRNYVFTPEQFRIGIKIFQNIEQNFPFAVDNTNHSDAILTIVNFKGKTYLVRDKVTYFLNIDQEAERKKEVRELDKNILFDAYLSGLYAQAQLKVATQYADASGHPAPLNYIDWFLSKQQELVDSLNSADDTSMDQVTDQYLKKLQKKVNKKIKLNSTVIDDE